MLTPICSCLNCGKILDATIAAINDNKPQHGDFTICLYCGHLMAFNVDITLRDLTDVEMITIAGDKALRFAQKLRDVYLRENPSKLKARRKQ